MSIAEAALEHVRDGSVLGLGTGHAASDFVRALGDRVRSGLSVRGVPTSEATAALARDQDIPLVSLDQVDEIDVTFDGADAVDPQLRLIKGLGGALLREKVVAASSRRLIILVGANKLTDVLGRGYCTQLPVEVIPFGVPLVRRRLDGLGFAASLRKLKGEPYITDNGNHILDVDVSATLPDPAELDRALRSIPGVVDSGLFLDMADLVLVGRSDGTVEALTRPPAAP